MDFEDSSIDVSNSYKTSDQRLIDGFRSMFKNLITYDDRLVSTIRGDGSMFAISLCHENVIAIHMSSFSLAIFPGMIAEVNEFLSNENFEKHESLQFFEILLYDIFLPKIVDKITHDINSNAEFKNFINLIKSIADEHEYRHTFLTAYELTRENIFTISMFYKNMTIDFHISTCARNDIKNKIESIYKDITERRIVINYIYGIRNMYNGIKLFDVLDLSYDIENVDAESTVGGEFKYIELKFNDISTIDNRHHTIEMSYDKYMDYLKFLKKYGHISEIDYEARRLEYEIMIS